MNNEFKRMQKLAGLITENQLKEASNEYNPVFTVKIKNAVKIPAKGYIDVGTSYHFIATDNSRFTALLSDIQKAMPEFMDAVNEDDISNELIGKEIKIYDRNYQPTKGDSEGALKVNILG
jgi:hypothetical protein